MRDERIMDARDAETEAWDAAREAHEHKTRAEQARDENRHRDAWDWDLAAGDAEHRAALAAHEAATIHQANANTHQHRADTAQSKADAAHRRAHRHRTRADRAACDQTAGRSRTIAEWDAASGTGPWPAGPETEAEAKASAGGE
jgi:hypothetical protein